MNKILRILLSFALLLIIFAPGDSMAFGGNDNSTLAAQSRFKPSAKIVKTEDGFVIIDDESQVEAVRDDFRDNVESVDLDTLRGQAEEIGLSDDGLVSLIQSHVRKISVIRSPVKSVQDGRQDRASEHVYTEVSGAETERILKELRQVIDKDWKSRLAKLIEVYNAGKGTYEWELALIDIEALNTSNLILLRIQKEVVFPNGLFKDENGVYWIMKRQMEPRGNWVSGWKQNVRKREELASLLLKHTSNQVEIRKLSREDVQRSPSLASVGDNTDEYYMARLIADGNIEEKELTHKDLRQANSAIFVADILIRKYDAHLGNKVPLKGVPISIDNDMTLGFDRNLYPDPRMDFKRFEFGFLMYFECGLPAMCLVDWSKVAEGSGNDLWRKNFFEKLNLEAEAVFRNNPEELVNEMTSIIHKIGIADSVVAATMLDEKYIRESILEHKRLKNIRETAIAAGYDGKELDEVVAMIDENRKTLGRDVNEILKAMTGKDYGFDKIDKEYEIAEKMRAARTALDYAREHARQLIDEFKLIDFYPETKPSFIAVGSSWFEEKVGANPIQKQELVDKLLPRLRTLCEARGIEFISGDDASVASQVLGILNADPSAKGVVVAGKDTVSDLDFDGFKNVFAAAIDNANISEYSFIDIVEMVQVMCELSRSASEIDREAVASIAARHPGLDPKFLSGKVIIFLPGSLKQHDLNTLKALYEVQRFA